MLEPYIGISDFTDTRQVRQMRQVFIESGGAEVGRKLHVGVMMSRKTLNGIHSEWTGVFPKNEAIAEIFMTHPAVVNVLHYADFEGIDEAENIEAAIKWAGPRVDAIQLDMIWPDPMTVRFHRELHPEIDLVLRVNAKAMSLVGDDPTNVAERLEEYGDAVDMVLLDRSMGSALPMEAETILPYAWRIAERVPSVRLAVAGGLGPGSVSLAEPIIREFPDVSIDASGRLRASGDAKDPVEWDRASRYLAEAIQLFRRCRTT